MTTNSFISEEENHINQCGCCSFLSYRFDNPEAYSRHPELNGDIIVHIPEYHCKNKRDDIIRFLEYCNKLGYYNEIVEVDESIRSEYLLSVKIEASKMVNGHHRLATHSLIRACYSNMFYEYDAYHQVIDSLVIRFLKFRDDEKLSKLTNYEIMFLAHITHRNCWYSYHGIIESILGYPTIVCYESRLTQDDIDDRFTDANTVHSTFARLKYQKKFTDKMKELLDDKKYEDLIIELENSKNIYEEMICVDPTSTLTKNGKYKVEIIDDNKCKVMNDNYSAIIVKLNRFK